MYQMRLPDLVRAGSGVVCRIWYEMTTCQLCRRKTVMLRKQPHEAFGASPSRTARPLFGDYASPPARATVDTKAGCQVMFSDTRHAE